MKAIIKKMKILKYTVIFISFISLVFYFWVKLNSTPTARVKNMTSLALPKNAELIFKEEQSNLTDFTYTYIFKLSKEYNCTELHMTEFDNTKKSTKNTDELYVVDYYKNKSIPKFSTKCILIGNGPASKKYNQPNEFSAASGNGYIGITISSGI